MGKLAIVFIPFHYTVIRNNFTSCRWHKTFILTAALSWPHLWQMVLAFPSLFSPWLWVLGMLVSTGILTWESLTFAFRKTYRILVLSLRSYSNSIPFPKYNSDNFFSPITSVYRTQIKDPSSALQDQNNYIIYLYRLCCGQLLGENKNKPLDSLMDGNY